MQRSLYANEKHEAIASTNLWEIEYLMYAFTGSGINRYPSFFVASKPPLDLLFFTFSKPRSSKKFWKKGRHCRARDSCCPPKYTWLKIQN